MCRAVLIVIVFVRLVIDYWVSSEPRSYGTTHVAHVARILRLYLALVSHRPCVRIAPPMSRHQYRCRGKFYCFSCWFHGPDLGDASARCARPRPPVALTHAHGRAVKA